MSQVSDYTLSNIGFSAFRTELNSILGAVNTLNACTSAPGSVAAGSLWLDTTNSITPTLKFYDGSDQISLCTFNYSANTVNWLDNTVTADLSGDTSPQLGGNLDTNSHNIIIDDAHYISDENNNEQIIFQTTSSAVNQFDITNAAAGNAPSIAATGGDTNIDLQLTAKGTGLVKMTGNSISGDVIPGKFAGTNFTNSLLIGHSTTGTLSSAGQNVGVGIYALDAITSGDNNTAVGVNSLTSVTSSPGNTAIGRYSGNSLATGNGYNTLLGYQSGYYHTTGIDNTAVGTNAVYGTDGQSGDSNTGVGRDALKLAYGDNNIGLGKEAGDNITTGDGNVIIGSINADSATGDKQLIIADGVNGSVAWIKGSSAGVVTLNAANVAQQAITSSSNAVAWDASAKPNAYHITTENTTFSAPTNAVEGAFICVEINYNGSHTIAFNTIFEFAASVPPTFTSTDAKTDILVFKYNGAVWQEVGRTLNLSES